MGFLRSTLLRLGLACFLGSTGTSIAQDAVDSGAVEAQGVVVTGRADDLIGEASSASQGTVSASDLVDRPILRRGELLEVVPGLVITQHSGDGKANQYFLRGFNLDHGSDFAISVDEMAVNLRTHAHGQGYSDLNFLIPELIDHIDYQKGPFYPVIGDFSGAGAAEFILRDALDQGIASTTLGEDFYLRSLIADSLKGGPGKLTLALEFTHYDGPWDHAEDSNRFNEFARYNWDHDDDHLGITFMGYHGWWNSTDQVAKRAVEEGLIDRFGTLDPSDGGYSSRYSLSLDWERNSGDVQTKANVYAIYYRLNLFSDFTYFLDDPVDGDQFEQIDRRFVLGGSWSRRWSDTWFGYQVDNTVGVQVRDDIIPEVAIVHTDNREELNTVRRDRVNEFSIGFYAQNEIHWTDWLRSRAGIRGDIYDFDVSSDLSANSGNVVDGIASPKLSLIFGPWAKTEYYIDAGTGFHSNDARGVTERVDPVTHLRVVSTSPLVRTESVEIGTRTSVLPGLVSTFSLWFLESDSELVFEGDSGTTSAAGKTRRYGVEWANFYKPISWLTFDGDLALTHARFVNEPAGPYIPNSIGAVISAGVTADAGHGPLASFRARYFGSQPLIEDNSARAPSSLLFDARLGYRWKNWMVAMDILNLFDAKVNDIEYFYTSRLRGEPLSGIDDFHLHPAEPRTFRGSVTYYF